MKIYRCLRTYPYEYMKTDVNIHTKFVVIQCGFGRTRNEIVSNSACRIINMMLHFKRAYTHHTMDSIAKRMENYRAAQLIIPFVLLRRYWHYRRSSGYFKHQFDSIQRTNYFAQYVNEHIDTQQASTRIHESFSIYGKKFHSHIILMFFSFNGKYMCLLNANILFQLL